jgi:hypothetical protein
MFLTGFVVGLITAFVGSAVLSVVMMMLVRFNPQGAQD